MKVESAEYVERVYAGVLGKVIGVMMGKPIEGWDFDGIVERFGVVEGYVHDRVGYPLVCTDDDTSGTFTFIRAIEDNGFPRSITSSQIGRTWLNYLIENQSVLSWGGIGASTEHTAYLRLLSGIQAPASGSARLNGKRVSEQIGAQIFIDGWAMLCPGDPDRAARAAIQAGEVSHDGEAVYGARALAAMEALAFDEPDIDALVECALAHIPGDSVIARIVREVRDWAAENGDDWQATRAKVEEKYSARQYGVAHMFPNHALIHLALWHGRGDLAKSLSIVNTCGWDTDCNSGNLGCLLGIRNGLDGIPSFLRDPIADRMYLPTADSGRGITDCLREALAIVNTARRWYGLEPLRRPRFSFSLPGSVQGFTSDAPVSNEDGHGLKIDYAGAPTTVLTPTYAPPNLGDMHGYELLTSPAVYSGQRLTAALALPTGDEWALVVREAGTGAISVSPWSPGGDLQWTVPQVPVIDAVGVALRGATPGRAVLERLEWSGAPDADLFDERLWVPAIEKIERWSNTVFLTQNHGLGVALTGSREWTDYEFVATVIPRIGRFGFAVRVQGLRRYVALFVDAQGIAQLVAELDGNRVLAERPIDLRLDEPLDVSIKVVEGEVVARIGGQELAGDVPHLLYEGGVAVLCDEGRVEVTSVRVRPA